ncbi:MAG TPA: ABC transporter permease [Vicinamibacterales bacterium]|nr:ABC transporter permease [Vicinamibacterales bacterium]
MTVVGRLVNLWRNLVHSNRVDRDLHDELQAVFELLVDEKVRSGMSFDDARRASRLELGSQEFLKDKVRDARAGAGFDTLLQDIRYALRQFRRAPGFTAVAVATLALGIGANAAIFGVVKSVLLDALPYADSDRLVRVYGRSPEGVLFSMRAAIVQTVAARQRSFESLAAFDSVRDAVYGGEDFARVVRIAWVEPRFFKTLGVPAALGRTFDDDDRAKGHVPASGAEIGPDTARVVVLSHSAWQGLFAGDPAVLGREIRINGLPRAVIGVLPPGFVGPNGRADFYFAFDLVPALGTGAGWLGLVGRVRAGATQEAAQRDIAAISADLGRESGNVRAGVWATPLRDTMVGSARTPLLVLLASTAFVLLIACANLAGGLLSRSLSRRKEFAVRVALGAGRGRLVRQLLTESTMLALAGGAAGLLLAQSMLSLLRTVARPVLPAYAELSLDPAAVLVTAVIAICTGLAFGVVPALSVDRLDAQGALRDDARGASEALRPRQLRGVLVACQMALCASLLAGAGLLSRSLWEMAAAPLGFDPSGVLTARIRLPTREYPTLELRTRFHEQLAERLRHIRGVEAVAIANKAPTLDPRRDPFSMEGAAKDAAPVVYASVSDDYFRTLGIPIREGRTFDASDRAGAPPTAVISESMARRYWPAGRALGSRIRLAGDLVTIVGIVGDVRNDLARSDAEPMAYRTHRQESTQRVAILLRTRGDPLALVKPLQRELAALDRSLPLQEAMTLTAAVGEGLAARRLPVMLMTAFGVLALLLASVGVYGMFASMAAAREREFGVRMALGSPPFAIAGLMLQQGAGWMAAGLAGGVLCTMVIVRLLRNVLDGVPPFDPIALGMAVAIMLGCATVALLIPVLRATRVDPMVALRAE